MTDKTFNKFIIYKNSKKPIFTAGPSSLLKENISGLGPCFGRGDEDYLKTENRVLSKLKKLSGQKNIISTQGSGSTALEIVALNFLYGNILIIKTGYYSDRLLQIVKLVKKTHKNIKNVKIIDWKKIDKYKKKIDWVWSCVTETSMGIKIPVKELKKFSNKVGAKLALDATASIGLENNHKLADVVSFSSCKGLFGLTGASFVCYKIKPTNKVNSFVLNIDNLKKKRMTGPYHTIQSLDQVLKKYDNLKKSVLINKRQVLKKYKKHLIYQNKNQPLLCSYINKKIKKRNSKVLLYKPRVKLKGSIICHLGEAHLGRKAKGKILDYLKIDD